MSYYNTTHLDRESLKEATRAAETQEEAVLAIFGWAGPAQRRPMLAPSDVHHLTSAIGRRWPLHSIRRAITTLTKDGKLERLDLKQMGPFGRPEYLWRAVQP